MSLLKDENMPAVPNVFMFAGKATQTGKAVLQLQLHQPQAKILYSSATVSPS